MTARSSGGAASQRTTSSRPAGPEASSPKRSNHSLRKPLYTESQAQRARARARELRARRDPLGSEVGRHARKIASPVHAGAVPASQATKIAHASAHDASVTRLRCRTSRRRRYRRRAPRSRRDGNVVVAVARRDSLVGGENPARSPAQGNVELPRRGGDEGVVARAAASHREHHPRLPLDAASHRPRVAPRRPHARVLSRPLRSRNSSYVPP